MVQRVTDFREARVKKELDKLEEELKVEKEKAERAESKLDDLRRSYDERMKSMIVERNAALQAVEAHRDQLKARLAEQGEVERQLKKELAEFEQGARDATERMRQEKVQQSAEMDSLKSDLASRLGGPARNKTRVGVRGLNCPGATLRVD